jgi:hypothetical protein
MKKTKTQKNRHTFTFFLPGIDKPVKRAVPCSDAKHPVDLEREEVDLLNGIPGMALECANAQCGLRLHDKFPHDVFMLEFDDSRAFAVDRMTKDNMPAHCIRYYHHEGDEQKEFDKPGGKRRLIKTGRAKKIVRLLAPTASTKHLPPKKPGRRKPEPDGRGPQPPRRGSIARWLRSKAA